jgi:hypothetical protein
MLPLIPLIVMQGQAPVPVTSLTVPKSIAPHARFTATLTVKFADGLHGYQNPPSDPNFIPVTVKLSKGDAKLVSIGYPKGTDMTMQGDTKPTKVYSGNIVIHLKLQAGTKSGPIVVAVGYQQCNESMCYPPSSVDAKATLHLAAK